MKAPAHIEQERGERLVDSGLRYGEEGPVLVRVRTRPGRWSVDDGRAAVGLAGRPPGWREVAHEVVERGFDLNVDRSGGVFVGTVYPGMVDELTARVAAASLALYRALLELDD